MFDLFVMTDWSSNGKPKSGKDSIWIAVLDSYGTWTLENPRTRQAAMDRIEALLTEATAAGRRVFAGFDFPMGYPVGTARELSGKSSWDGAWHVISGAIGDTPKNVNDRFDAAAVLNASFPGLGPFWGNGLKRDIPGLTRNKPRLGWGEHLPPRLRYAETLIPRAQETFKLNGAGSVGGQTLTGIARLQKLRQSRDDVQVWPFETLGEGRSHVLAEIYPSMIAPYPGDEVLDARQVKAMALAMRELDRRGDLERYLQAPKDMPGQVRREEGAILGMHDQPGFRAAAAQAMSGCGSP